MIAARFQSKKDNANKGRWFSTCAKRDCKFFKWDPDRYEEEEAAAHEGEGRKKLARDGDDDDDTMVQIPRIMMSHVQWTGLAPGIAPSVCYICGDDLPTGTAYWSINGVYETGGGADVPFPIKACDRCGGEGANSVLDAEPIVALGRLIRVKEIERVCETDLEKE